jgi:hypothetical protein
MCDDLISPPSVHQVDGQRVPTQYSLSYRFARCCNIIGIYDSKQDLISSAAHSTALQLSELVALPSSAFHRSQPDKHRRLQSAAGLHGQEKEATGGRSSLARMASAVSSRRKAWGCVVLADVAGYGALKLGDGFERPALEAPSGDNKKSSTAFQPGCPVADDRASQAWTLGCLCVL